MHIAVLLAGVADPRKPLPRPASGDWRELPCSDAISYKLSPFDEAALEIALKLRDQGAAARVTVVVTDGALDNALLRSVAALKPDRLLGLSPPAGQRGSAAWLARHAGDLLRADGAWPDLVLIGREHGDLDDGMTPAYLAESWRLPFVNLALQVQAGISGGWALLRSGARQDESLQVPAPAMASISNDKSNRLRHPLMKNVAMAKQFKFEQVTPDAGLAATPATPATSATPATFASPAPSAAPARPVTLVQAAPCSSSARGAQACHMFTGSVEEQAAALVAYLRAPTIDH